MINTGYMMCLLNLPLQQRIQKGKVCNDNRNQIGRKTLSSVNSFFHVLFKCVNNFFHVLKNLNKYLVHSFVTLALCIRSSTYQIREIRIIYENQEQTAEISGERLPFCNLIIDLRQLKWEYIAQRKILHTHFVGKMVKKSLFYGLSTVISLFGLLVCSRFLFSQNSTFPNSLTLINVSFNYRI